MPARVLRLVAEAAGLSIEALVGTERSLRAARARAVSAYLLRHDAGLETLDTARILHLKTNTVNKLIAAVEQVAASTDPRAQLLERTRRLFKNGLGSGKHYPSSPNPNWRSVRGLLRSEEHT